MYRYIHILLLSTSHIRLLLLFFLCCCCCCCWCSNLVQDSRRVCSLAIFRILCFFVFGSDRKCYFVCSCVLYNSSTRNNDVSVCCASWTSIGMATHALFCRFLCVLFFRCDESYSGKRWKVWKGNKKGMKETERSPWYFSDDGCAILLLSYSLSVVDFLVLYKTLILLFLCLLHHATSQNAIQPDSPSFTFSTLETVFFVLWGFFNSIVYNLNMWTAERKQREAEKSLRLTEISLDTYLLKRNDDSWCPFASETEHSLPAFSHAHAYAWVRVASSIGISELLWASRIL